jgi:hypothetical protein
MRDNRNLIGAARSVPSPKTALEAAPNPFSALFDNRKLRRLAGVSEAGARCRNPERSERIPTKSFFLKTFHVSPLM